MMYIIAIRTKEVNSWKQDKPEPAAPPVGELEPNVSDVEQCDIPVIHVIMINESII